ncbi:MULTISPECIES: hypothetical protein [Yersinia]|uniref:hypothetical protein n=1 Tax=Yersinia TaxID=629 RepID=UPI000A610C32|nr:MULTISPECIES: hypothetical protein [Yersinia]
MTGYSLSLASLSVIFAKNKMIKPNAALNFQLAISPCGLKIMRGARRSPSPYQRNNRLIAALFRPSPQKNFVMLAAIIFPLIFYS